MGAFVIIFGVKMNATIFRRTVGAAVSAVSVLTAVLGQGAPSWSAVAPTPVGAGYTKVLVIVEENRTYDEIIGGADAPFLTKIAASFGTATNMSADYPVGCPSLAGYLLMTSGSRSGICDDQGPKHHPLTGPNVFAQAAAAHLNARTYAESIPSPCAAKNSADGLFLVRHTPVAYYSSEATRCATDDVELGALSQGALHDDLAAGTLPSYGFVTPNVCHDMHGGTPCPSRRIANGDAWLSQWLPAMARGRDYRAGRLVIIVTWDEGSSASNHIPTLVISPTTRHIAAAAPFTHCSTLRTVEDVLRLAPLGCARTAPSMASAFHL
jgi:hypothetical protein